MQIAIIIANEALDSRLKSSRGGVLCKLDIKKAYGHVNWEFLLVVFKKMGFGQKWIGLIQWCISKTRFCVAKWNFLVVFFSKVQEVKASRSFFSLFVHFRDGDL